MSPNVLLPQRGSSRISRLVNDKPEGACARSLASRISVVSRAAIKLLDRILRHILGICEFTQEQDCVLRYSRTRSQMAVTLSSGEAVRRGDPILELHFWNDRLGADCHPRSSPRVLRSALRQSLVLLAEQLQSNKHFADIKAVHATLARTPSRSYRVHHPFGCALYIAPRSNTRPIHDFFEDFLIHSLRWAFNPSRRKRRSLRLNRLELWIAASDLKARFGELRCQNFAWVTSLGDLHLPGQYTTKETETVEAGGD